MLEEFENISKASEKAHTHVTPHQLSNSHVPNANNSNRETIISNRKDSSFGNNPKQPSQLIQNSHKNGSNSDYMLHTDYYHDFDHSEEKSEAENKQDGKSKNEEKSKENDKSDEKDEKKNEKSQERPVYDSSMFGMRLRTNRMNMPQLNGGKMGMAIYSNWNQMGKLSHQTNYGQTEMKNQRMPVRRRLKMSTSKGHPKQSVASTRTIPKQTQRIPIVQRKGIGIENKRPYKMETASMIDSIIPHYTNAPKVGKNRRTTLQRKQSTLTHVPTNDQVTRTGPRDAKNRSVSNDLKEQLPSSLISPQNKAVVGNQIGKNGAQEIRNRQNADMFKSMFDHFDNLMRSMGNRRNLFKNLPGHEELALRDRNDEKGTGKYLICSCILYINSTQLLLENVFKYQNSKLLL